MCVAGRDGAADLGRDLVRLGVRGTEIRFDHPDDVAVVGRGRQRDEAGDSTVSVAGTGNRQQLVPGWAWATAGFVVGFLVGAAVGPLFSMGDVTAPGRAALVGLCGGLAGASVGFVYGLSHGPEVSEQGRDGPATSVLSVPVTAIRGHREVVRRIGTDPVTSWWLAPAPGPDRHRFGTAQHPVQGGRRFGASGTSEGRTGT